VAAAGLAGVVGAYAAYTLKSSESWSPISVNSVIPVTYAAAKLPPPSQPSVFSPTKEHALYLWIHLSPKADQKACAKVVADLDAHCDAVSPADLRDETNEVIAGVGYGTELYLKVIGLFLKKILIIFICSQKNYI